MPMKLACFTAAYTIKLYHLKNSHAQEVKILKERISVLVGYNSDWSEKLPIFMIGKVRTLPVEHTMNRKAGMTDSVL